MNTPGYQWEEEPAVKRTVKITRRQLWNNFITSLADVMWDGDGSVGICTLQRVMDVLLSGKPLVDKADALCKLFRDGYTVMLLGEAMKELDVRDRKNILMEIRVTDDNDPEVVIIHKDINF